MPRSKKNITWMVSVDGIVVKDIHSKTYLGACYKAFKKLGIETPKLTRTIVQHYNNNTTIQYDDSFKGVYCIEQ